MSNQELAAAFERIADLLEITGADSFRVSSYRRAARTLGDTGEDVAGLAEAGRLNDLPGVGKSTAGKIDQFLREGKIDLLEELSAKVPAGLPALLDVPGLGPKKVAILHEQLKIGSIDDLKAALLAGKIEELAGFGKTSATKIAEGLESLATLRERTPLGMALPIAEGLCEALSAMEQVGRVQLAGSARRGMESVGDLDLVCESEAGEEVVAAFTELPGVKRVVGKGSTKGSIVMGLPAGLELRAQVRVVPPESYGAALQYFTGSKEHNVRVREIAGKRGWKLNEWGLFEGDTSLAGADEEGIYEKLGLPCPPPELREDRFEFDAGFDASLYVSIGDIRGDLHVHTTASDGKNSIEEMGDAAKALGYEYLAITDHSKSSAIANGLSVERLERHIEEIHAANKRMKGFTLLAGCECDILATGKLDYSDELLATCDWVVASVHSGLSGGRMSPTERTVRAMQNPYVCCIGHPTGRLLGSRAAMKIDMGAVIRAAAETGTALEVNASWQRLDLKDVHVRQAIEAGVPLVINTDAHSVGGLGTLELGVTTARRGGCPADMVLNTWTATKLRKWIDKKRAR